MEMKVVVVFAFLGSSVAALSPRAVSAPRGLAVRAHLHPRPPLLRCSQLKLCSDAALGSDAAPIDVAVSAAGVDKSSAVEERPPYVLTGLPRPAWRGRMMGWLHRTKLWYLVSVAYVVLVLALSGLSNRARISGSQLLWRLLAAAATSANVRISDGYHNGDKRAPEGLTPKAERTWLRWDYFGISAVLATQYLLWADNFGWGGRLRAAGIASGVAVALVSTISALVVPKKAGHTAVKAIMGLQFVVLLGYLVRFVSCAGVAAAQLNLIIFWVYAPGLILYALKRPQRKDFGFHEGFHLSVLCGHCASMALDVRNVLVPCAIC